VISPITVSPSTNPPFLFILIFVRSLDDSTKTVDDLFERIAQSELTRLASELSDDDFEMVSWRVLPPSEISCARPKTRQLSAGFCFQVAAALYGYKNGLAHFVCGDLVSLEPSSSAFHDRKEQMCLGSGAVKILSTKNYRLPGWGKGGMSSVSFYSMSSPWG
jgi:hypothetical protein